MDQPPPRQPPLAHLSHILQHSPQRPPPPPLPLPLPLHHHLSHRHQREPHTRTLPPTLRSDIIPGLAGPSRYDCQTSPRVPPHATLPPSLSLRPPPLEPYVKTNEGGQVTKPKTWQGPDPRSLSKVMAIPVRHQQAEAPRVLPLVKTTNMPDSVPPTHRQLATHETSATDDQTMHRKDSTDSQPSRTSNVSQSTSNSAEFASEGMSGAQDTRDRPKGAEPSGRRSAPDERSSQQAASEPAGQSQSPPRARRTRVLMTRMQWTALNRLWDQHIHTLLGLIILGILRRILHHPHTQLFNLLHQYDLSAPLRRHLLAVRHHYLTNTLD
ncbi:uncharacterized protein LOC62_07G009551 [Vanrija pseudolonga]|uniref:Uncharacterized protein n=1 Tax=Vanrija pseudolonga TaxID=143232 RepID=A0AAF0YGP1_9TREE|nr:hypothetical protein LOC62_07G009551 [Vanrija pseudolonga]